MPSFKLGFKLGILVAVAVLAGACTSDSVNTTDPAPAPTTGVTSPTEADSTSDVTPAVATEPLGFSNDLYDVPVPVYDPEAGRRPVIDSEDLLDLGVAEGTWSEVEGVRAMVSVLMGELPLEAVPDLAELPHKAHSHLLDRAETLMADAGIPDDERADLARLTAFFFADVKPQPEAGARLMPVVHQIGCPVGSVPLSEFFAFGAPNTSTCYWVTFTDDGDTIFVPAVVDELDEGATTAELEELLTIARTGYLEHAGSAMPEVQLLLSTTPAPDEAEGQAIGRLSGSSCRVTIFNTPDIVQRATNFRHTVAHELFHCVQVGWGDNEPSEKFVQEGGADYFAYRLLGECGSGITQYGPDIDRFTTDGSLLDTVYEGWYFWAYLDEHGHLSSQEISALHQSIGGGLSVESALGGRLANLPGVINEFYVLMMGPGLACDLRGQEVSSEEDVTDISTLTLNAEFWVGTRYRLKYAAKKFFEQTDPGGGPMGMAPESSRSSKDEWVVMAEEVRSTCTEKEPMLVVVTSSGTTAEERKIVVDEVTEGACDPCLIGEWSVDMDSLETFYEASPGALDMDLAGSVRLEFEGAPNAAIATVTDKRNFSMTILGQTLNRDGEGVAQYSGDGEFMAISDYVESGIVSILDSSSPFAGLAGQDGTGAYTCDGDEMTVTRPEGARFTAVRDPATPPGDPYFGD